jgi:phage tail-like protein
MLFSNLEYLYEHLPARFRRDDDELFLKRFLSFFGEQLDKWDGDLDNFYQSIAPETASEEFIDWWLWSLFGWGWFPTWFTLERKRTFYANIATHYAQRGTAKGIKEFLAAFGIGADVITESQYWGDFTWGEDTWTMTGPLGIVVRLHPQVDAVNEDLSYWGDWAWGEGVLASPSQSLQHADVDELLRFEWPLGNDIVIEDLTLAAI